MDTKVGMIWPPAKELLEPPEGRSSKEKPSSRAVGGRVSLRASWFQISGLQKCEKTNFWFLSHHVCGKLLQQPRKWTQPGWEISFHEHLNEQSWGLWSFCPFSMADTWLSSVRGTHTGSEHQRRGTPCLSLSATLAMTILSVACLSVLPFSKCPCGFLTFWGHIS